MADNKMVFMKFKWINWLDRLAALEPGPMTPLERKDRFSDTIIMKQAREKWHKRFLKQAEHIAQWSKDPSAQVGAIIVNEDNVIVGSGYNGFPRGVKDHPSRYNDREKKLKYIVHAELNAILNATGSLKNCTIYVWPTLGHPACCSNCAKAVIQSGIKRLVYYNTDKPADRWKDDMEASKTMFLEAGVEVVVLDK